jgi:hypothetical protein
LNGGRQLDAFPSFENRGDDFGHNSDYSVITVKSSKKRHQVLLTNGNIHDLATPLSGVQSVHKTIILINDAHVAAKRAQRASHRHEH